MHPVVFITMHVANFWINLNSGSIGLKCGIDWCSNFHSTVSETNTGKFDNQKSIKGTKLIFWLSTTLTKFQSTEHELCLKTSIQFCMNFLWEDESHLKLIWSCVALKKFLSLIRIYINFYFLRKNSGWTEVWI